MSLLSDSSDEERAREEVGAGADGGVDRGSRAPSRASRKRKRDSSSSTSSSSRSSSSAVSSSSGAHLNPLEGLGTKVGDYFRCQFLLNQHSKVLATAKRSKDGRRARAQRKLGRRGTHKKGKGEDEDEGGGDIKDKAAAVAFPTDAEARRVVASLPDPNAAAKARLFEHYVGHFPKWLLWLRAGFSLLLYGFGSKKRLLETFAAVCNRTARASTGYKIINRAFDPSPCGTVFDGEIDYEPSAPAVSKGREKGKDKKGRGKGKGRGKREPNEDEPFPSNFEGCGCGDVLVVRGFHPKMTLRVILDSIADALDLDAMAEAAMAAAGDDDGDDNNNNAAYDGDTDDDNGASGIVPSSSSFSYSSSSSTALSLSSPSSSSSSSSRRGGNRLLRRCREIAKSFSGKAPPLGTPGFTGGGGSSRSSGGGEGSGSGARRLYLIVHNIDGPGLRTVVAQTGLGILASADRIHLAASIDHVNAALLWDQSQSQRFNFLTYDATTFERYEEETAHSGNVIDVTNRRRTGEDAAAGAEFVLSSLTKNHRDILKVIATHQMASLSRAKAKVKAAEEESGAKGRRAHSSLLRPERHGISFAKLYDKCREQMLVTSDLSLRNYLREFTDHQLVERKAASAGGGAGGSSSSSSSSSSSVKYVYVINLVEDVIRKVILAEKSESGG